MQVTFEARFYLTNRRDSVPIIQEVDVPVAWDETWADNGPHGWHRADLYRHGPKRTNILIDRVYS